MIHALNVAAGSLAVLLSVMAGIYQPPSQSPTPRPDLEPEDALVRVDLPNGKTGLRDASGEVIPLLEYQRIVSGSTVADALLLELASPKKVQAYSIYSEQSPLGPHRYEGKPHVDALDDLEGVLALQPDLLILNTHCAPAPTARLREAGVQIFNLGEMTGLDSYMRQAETVGALLGDAARGRKYARDFADRLSRVAPHFPDVARRTAVYVALYGGKMFGGAKHTSYDDVLRHAGLRNIAAERYHGWPQYDAEQLLMMNPEIIVTVEGMGAALCRHVGLDNLRACSGPGRVVELPRALIGNPAAGMLPATEALHVAVFSSRDQNKPK